MTEINIKQEKTNKVPDWEYGDILYCAYIDGKYSLYQICPQEVECKEERGFDWQLEGYQYTPLKSLNFMLSMNMIGDRLANTINTSIQRRFLIQLKTYMKVCKSNSLS